MKKTELLEIFENFLNENGLWGEFVIFARERGLSIADFGLENCVDCADADYVECGAKLPIDFEFCSEEEE